MAVWAAEMGFLNQVESTETDPVDVIRRLKGTYQLVFYFILILLPFPDICFFLQID